MTHERAALLAVWQHKSAWLLFLLSGAALAALILAAFWIPDARAGFLLLSILSVLALGSALLCWLGATFSYYRQAHESAAPALRQAIAQTLSRLPKLWAWLILASALAWISHPAVLILVAPFAARWRPRFLPSFVLVIALCALASWGLWNWRPVRGALALETASLAARAGLAYALIVTGWIYLASLMGRLHAESRAPAN